ncbi:Glycerol-3-phosphate dehydrogenase [NAD(P)+] [Trichlorobacter ammonificans]|uniref:Glycerol-3-phosphate dehydrogenase [NAD(P)+] n=2 Tax=Trichlorobacter ammonificans TaxID=2916410 RepID=A0ABM9D633_9BACT|nr:Glycerol-3-phosphate dehydrogenase [NAD(P)+] [Trichlorobacter ammonificans]
MKIGVIGAGSWGTALANLLAGNGHEVVLWAYEPELVEEMTRQRSNSLFLPGVSLHPDLICTGELSRSVLERELVLLVAPTQVARGLLSTLAPCWPAEAVLVNASKGIELTTLATVSDIVAQTLGAGMLEHYVVLSGPTFAREVALGLPSLIVAASRNEQAARLAQSAFSNQTFRVYTSDDPVGVELGGAIKNVLAIAAGISDGLGFGHNTRAALITRGLVEMRRLGRAMGARDESFSGLAGMGDLVLTCTGDLSRNRTVGMKLGQGMTLAAILAEMRMVAEGVKTSESVYFLAQSKGVEMPICEKVFEILHRDKPAREAVLELMTRELKAEYA